MSSDRSCSQRSKYVAVLAHAVLTLALAFAFPAGLRSAEYSITDLGTLGGATSLATGINNEGQVVGSAQLAGGATHAFLYSSGLMQDLGTLGGANSGATGINDEGQITGSAWTSTNNTHAFLYSGGSMQDLGTLASGPGPHRSPTSQGSGINNLGQIVGNSNVDDVTIHAFLYSGSTMQDLMPAGGAPVVATAINDSGAIVGQLSNFHAFLNDGAVHDLGTLGGLSSYATSINNTGQLVGYSDTATAGIYRAFVYTGGSMVALGTLGGPDSMALGINNLGQIVGGADILAGNDTNYHGFMYSNGTMVDLNTVIDPAVGWDIQKATAINDLGQIVGWGTIDGAKHAYLMTPVPEPAGLALATLGGLALLAYRRCRHKRSGFKTQPAKVA